MVDKLIHHTLHNWTFGTSNTGDLMEKEMLEELIRRAECMGPIQLVTADGSVDCQANPGDQEINTHNIHLCEIVAALSMLSPGGSFVIKKFTMLECNTINMIYLLCCVFKEVKVFKPGSSKEGNSEVYVICLDYYGKHTWREHLQILCDAYGTFEEKKAMFNMEDLPGEFISQIKKCAEIFKAYQVNTITKNLSLYNKMTEKDKQYFELLKYKISGMFHENNFCTRISKKQMLTEDKVNRSRYLLESDLSKTVTSIFVRSKCPREKLNFAKKCLDTYIEEFNKRKWIVKMTKEENYNVYKFPCRDLDSIEFEVLRGEPYDRIKTTKFCSPKVLECFRVLYNLWDTSSSNITLSLDETLLELVLKEHPDVPVLRTDVSPDPVYNLGALLEALVMIKDKKLTVGSSLILFNVTLFSRLQCGLLFVLSSAFHSVVVYTSNQMGEKAPIILLENFRSDEHGEAIMKAVHNTGWNPFDGDPAIVSRLLQLVSYTQLAETMNLCCLYFYNLHHCIHRSIRLQNSLENLLK